MLQPRTHVPTGRSAAHELDQEQAGKLAGECLDKVTAGLPRVALRDIVSSALVWSYVVEFM